MPLDRREFLTGASAAAALLAAGNKPSQAEGKKAAPNLLFLMCDQLRIDMLSCYGNNVISTPNIDRVAKEGVRFTNSNCAYPVCCPSRTIILTGRSSANTHVRANDAAQDRSINPGPSFDNILHTKGYNTQYYGKYHAPYALASTYDNVVASEYHFPGIPNEKAEYVSYLVKKVGQHAATKDQLMDAYSGQPYNPYAVDCNSVQGASVSDRGVKETDLNSVGVLQVPTEHSLTTYQTEQGLAALDGIGSKTFSMTISLMQPHPPFMCVEPYASMFPFDKMPLPVNFAPDPNGPYVRRAEEAVRFHHPDFERQFKSAYYAMVKAIDDNMGRVLKKLDDLKLTENTLVIFTSDHGEMLGSHGMVSKMCFYDESLQVPLLMRFPGVIKPHTVVMNPVSGIDLFPTILDYLNVPAPQRDGHSLRNLIEKKPDTGPDYRISEWATRAVPNFMVRTNDWKLMMADEPSSKSVDALYDMQNDPYEMNNLLRTDKTKAAPRADELKQRLISWMQRVNDPAIAGVKARRLV